MRGVSERIPVRFGLFNQAPAKRRLDGRTSASPCVARNKERSLAPGSSASPPRCCCCCRPLLCSSSPTFPSRRLCRSSHRSCCFSSPFLSIRSRSYGTMKSFVVATLLTLVTAATAFTSPAVTVSLQQRAARTSSLAAVIDIGSEDAFDKTIKKAGGGVVVIDYSTTWCGPCKGVCVGLDAR